MNYPDWLLWLGGTLLPLGLLWALWRLALRPERCYGYNRALLLLAPLVAAALPLLPHPVLPAWLLGGNSQVAPVASVVLPVLPTGATAPLAASVVAGWPWLLVLYVLGVGVGLVQLGRQVWRLRQLGQQLPRLDYTDYTLVHTGGHLPTSTFGRVVFWDETVALAPAEATAVLAHELTHVRQHHTADVLWLQVWRAVLWPNPFVHLLLPALRFTHELLADQAATTGAAPEPYASLLARLAASRPRLELALLQPFAFSSTLTRITMLKTSTPVRRWKQWLVLPLVAGLFCTLEQSASAQTVSRSVSSGPADSPEQEAYRNRLLKEAMRRDSLRGPISPDSMSEVMTTYPSSSNPTYSVRVVRVRKGEWMRPDGTLEVRPWPPGGTNFFSEPAPGTEKLYTYVEQMPQLPGGGGQFAIVKAIQDKLAYPVGNKATGRVFAKFTVNSKGVVQNAEIVKGLNAACDQAVLAAINQLPQFTPGQQSGRTVSVSFTVPVQFEKKR